jgi:hypothetical protein
MAEKPRRTEGEPHDRLTRICDAMSATFAAHPEQHEDDKCVIFLDGDGRGGMVTVNYDDDAEALANVFMHLRALFRVNGKDLTFVPIEQIGRDEP